MRMPDGTIIKNVPEGMSKADVLAKYEKATGKVLTAPARDTAADIKAGMRMPDGTIIKNVPEGMSKADVLAKYEKSTGKVPVTPAPARDTATDIKAAKEAGVKVPVTPAPYDRGHYYDPLTAMGDFIVELGRSSQQVQDIIANGMTMGLGRHAQALGRSAAVGGDSYKEELGEIDAGRRSFSEKAPGALPALELTGAMLGPGAVAKGLTMPQLLKLGAAEGAVSGAAYATDEDSDTLDAAIGATIGAGLGTALPAAMAGSGWAGRKVLERSPKARGAVRGAKRGVARMIDAISPGEAEAVRRSADRLAPEQWDQGQVDKAMIDYFRGAGVDPSAMASKAQRLGPGTVPADAAGDPGRILLTQVASESPAAQGGGAARVMARADDAADTLVKQTRLATRIPKEPVAGRLEKATGVPVSEAQELPKRLKEGLTEGAREDFGKLRREMVEITPEMRKLFSYGGPKTMAQEAKFIAELYRDDAAIDAIDALTPKRKPGLLGADELEDLIPVPGEELAGLADEVDEPVFITLEAADNVRRRMGDLLQTDAYTNKFTGEIDSKGRALLDLKNAYTDMLTEQVPGLSTALDNYAGRADVINAARRGDKLLSMTTEEVSDAFQRLKTESEKTAFRSRVLNSLIEKSGQAAEDSTGVFKFLTTPNMKKKLRTVFGEKTAAQIARITDEVAASRLVESAAQTGPSGLKTMLSRPKNVESLTEALGKQRVDRLKALVERYENIEQTAKYAGAGANLAAERAVKGFREKGLPSTIAHVAHAYTPTGAAVIGGYETAKALTKRPGFSKQALDTMFDALTREDGTGELALRLLNPAYTESASEAARAAARRRLGRKALPAAVMAPASLYDYLGR